MKTNWVAPLALIFLPFFSFAQENQKKIAPDETKHLLQLEQRWNDALVTKDTIFIKSLLDKNFIYVSPDASIFHRNDILKNVTNPDIRVEPFVTENVIVRIFEQTAILTGIFTQKFTYNNQPYKQKMSYTDVYIKTSTGWKVVSAHATLIN